MGYLGASERQFLHLGLSERWTVIHEVASEEL